MNSILIVAATGYELVQLNDYLSQHWSQVEPGRYQKNNVEVQILITGVGSTFTAFHVAHFQKLAQITLALNAGIAGAFDRTLNLGEVVFVKHDLFADLGVEESDGSFTDLFELELLEQDHWPFQNSGIKNDHKVEFFDAVKKVSGITVNKVHGQVSSILQIKDKYSPQIETMEGAGFFYACKFLNLPCIQIRTISNYVEKRNRANWRIELAIERLNDILIKYLQSLCK